MAASKESIEKVKELAEKRRYDPSAAKEWDKLVKAYDRHRASKTPADIQGDALEALIPKLAAVLDKSKKKDDESLNNDSDCGDDSPCGGGTAGAGGTSLDQINLEQLAERVFDRLVYEARVESERAGWAA